jgi:dTDP-4-amino-4,6-dideoxygalactose transaminase
MRLSAIPAQGRVPVYRPYLGAPVGGRRGRARSGVARDRPAHITCFSFGPVKMITTLEGGAVLTTDPADIQALHELRHLGIDVETDARYRNQRNWEFDVGRQGYRCHMGSIPAAIGLAQLEMVDEFIANRQEYFRVYYEAFRGLEERGDVVFFDTDWKDVAPYIYVLRVQDAARRSDLIAHLDGLGVSTDIHFLGAHEFSFYAGCRRGDPTVTDRVTEQVLTLPLHPYMDKGALGRVTDDVPTFFRAA